MGVIAPMPVMTTHENLQGLLVRASLIGRLVGGSPDLPARKCIVPAVSRRANLRRARVRRALNINPLLAAEGV